MRNLRIFTFFLTQARTQPNQGIWRSVANALFAMLGFGLIGLLGFGLIGGGLGLVTGAPVAGLFIGLFFGAFIVLICGVFVALWLGGATFIKHFFLRLILISSGSIPWNYAHFLDYCAERIFLRKVGGGYIFVHRLLLEHFAEE